uniref:Transmembrane protein n=1 Tax=Leersia perrieri TaxID=77586 RepID=A0A0D9XUY1_9ORYZ
MATPNNIVDLEKGMGNTIRHTAIDDESDDNADEDMNQHTGMALVGLFFYYVFFVYYMIGTCKKWWHAALAIGAASALLLLSIGLVIMQINRNNEKLPHPQDNTQNHLDRRLLASTHQ